MSSMPKEFGDLSTLAKVRSFGPSFRRIREERGDAEAWWALMVHIALE